MTGNFHTVVTQLRQWELLQRPEEFICCNEAMQYRTDNSRIDGCRFRCIHCNATQSFRANSIFSGTSLPLPTIFRLFFVHFAKNKSQEEFISSFGLAKNTVSYYYNYLRRCVGLWLALENNAAGQMGQVPYLEHHIGQQAELTPAVEIDETLVTHRVGAGDIYERQIWVLGIYDRATREIRAWTVGGDRTADRLLPIIQNTVFTEAEAPTRIYTDGFASYRGLPDLG